MGHGRPWILRLVLKGLKLLALSNSLFYGILTDPLISRVLSESNQSPPHRRRLTCGGYHHRVKRITSHSTSDTKG